MMNNYPPPDIAKKKRNRRRRSGPGKSGSGQSETPQDEVGRNRGEYPDRGVFEFLLKFKINLRTRSVSFD